MPPSSPIAASSTTLGRGSLAVLPGLFVVLWSSGFIGAKLGLPHAGPLTFLSLRFALVTAVMLAASLVARAAWPRRREAGHIAVVGALLQGLYLSGVFVSLAHGVSAGVVALIVSLQPLLTAALAGTMLGERVSGRQWFGFALGSTTLFASALLTGGVGPWLPFQMLAASWVGLGAGLLPRRVGFIVVGPPCSGRSTAHDHGPVAARPLSGRLAGGGLVRAGAASPFRRGCRTEAARRRGDDGPENPAAA